MAVTDLAPGQIDQPGVYVMSAEQYHADPVAGRSLSSTGARKLLPPSCPALFRHEQLHGQEPKREFDIGHAAHKLVLGTGPDLVIVDADSWRTKAAKEAAKEARESGAVPLLPDDYAQVKAMADALHAHPVASALFNSDRGGYAEQTLIWRDHQTGIMRRALLDWLPERGRGRTVIPDYKSCRSADPDALSKAVASFGYHQQDDWYTTGAQELGLADPEAKFVFVCQEKTPPYLVTIIELDQTARRIGKARNRQALSIYQWCLEQDRWPAYADDIAMVSLPRWAEIAQGGEDL